MSPLSSNILLDDLERELARRGHTCCRYGDDCNGLVRTRGAGERVMVSLSRLLAVKLKLKVNEAKAPWTGLGDGSSWAASSGGKGNDPIPVYGTVCTVV